jgi:hypothetical protein
MGGDGVTPVCCSEPMEGCFPCSIAPPLGQTEPSLARQTFPVWGTLLAISIVVLPLFVWQLRKEGHI